jgi:hypothetical protein
MTAYVGAATSLYRTITRYVEEVNDELKMPICWLSVPFHVLIRLNDTVLFIGYVPPKKKAYLMFTPDFDAIDGYYARFFLRMLFLKGFYLRFDMKELNVTTTHVSFLARDNGEFCAANVIFIVRQNECEQVSERLFVKLCEKALGCIENTTTERPYKYVCTVDFDPGMVHDVFNRMCSYRVETYHPNLIRQKSFPVCIVHVATNDQGQTPVQYMPYI